MNKTRDNAMCHKLGMKFISWGLMLFILGFFIGFIPIIHYIHGAAAGGVGAAFLANVTLWWGCPAVLVEYVLKTGSIGMVVIGILYKILAPNASISTISKGERTAPLLCIVGLIGATIYACVGYVVFQKFWPNFYFEPVEMGKNVWLGGQAIFILVYFIGVVYAFNGLRRNHFK